MSETEQDTTATAKEDERRALWSDLPDPAAPEEMTTSEDTTPPTPDLVPDPEHEFMIRHAG